MSGDAEGQSSRRLSGVVALGGTVVLCALAVLLYVLDRPATPPAAPAVPPAAAVASAPPHVAGAWQNLTPAQRDALNPLAAEWQNLDTTRQRKWLAIADRFPQMSETERDRTQERMREWVRLTPDQRRVARDSYLRAHALPPEKRAELLAKYQQLPDDEKEHLTALNKEHKSVLPVKPHGRQEPLPNKDQIREGSAQKVPGLMAVRPADDANSAAGKSSSAAAAAALPTPPAAAAAAPLLNPPAAAAPMPSASAPAGQSATAVAPAASAGAPASTSAASTSTPAHP